MAIRRAGRPAPYVLRLRDCARPGWTVVRCQSQDEALAGVRFATGSKGTACEAVLCEWSARNRRYNVVSRVSALRHVTHLPRGGAAPKKRRGCSAAGPSAEAAESVES